MKPRSLQDQTEGVATPDCVQRLLESGTDARVLAGADYAAVAQRVRRTQESDVEGRLRQPLQELQQKCQSV